MGPASNFPLNLKITNWQGKKEVVFPVMRLYHTLSACTRHMMQFDLKVLLYYLMHSPTALTRPLLTYWISLPRLKQGL